MTDLNTVRNIVINASKPGVLLEMCRKLALRFTEKADRAQLAKTQKEYSETAVNVHEWATRIDANLWKESQQFADDQTKYADEILSRIPCEMGGGGFYALLYFITRLLKPVTIVETGVAAGYSSRAFLFAIRANNTGYLYSSDFPYFRIENPEKYIGILVEPELRGSWDLHTKGDRENLPAILSMVNKIDLFHYDSDKSFSGRQYALETLASVMAEETLIIFDDIQDNLHFTNLVENRDHLIFHFGGKFVGVIVPNSLTKIFIPAH